MNPPKALLPGRPRLMDQVRERLRVKHYSIRTEQVYTSWIKRFILFHGKRHPKACHPKAPSEKLGLCGPFAQRMIVLQLSYFTQSMDGKYGNHQTFFKGPAHPAKIPAQCA